MFKIDGKLVYEPNRNVSSKWWLTVEVPKFAEVARYYRWLMDATWWEADNASYTKRDFHSPPHFYHVSIIRGEKPRKNIDQWGKYLAKSKVELVYSNNIKQTSTAKDNRDNLWFVDAKFDEYASIRKYFGLDYQRNGVPFNGHITIARAY